MATAFFAGAAFFAALAAAFFAGAALTAAFFAGAAFLAALAAAFLAGAAFLAAAFLAGAAFFAARPGVTDAAALFTLFRAVVRAVSTASTAFVTAPLTNSRAPDT